MTEKLFGMDMTEKWLIVCNRKACQEVYGRETCHVEYDGGSYHTGGRVADSYKNQGFGMII